MSPAPPSSAPALPPDPAVASDGPAVSVEARHGNSKAIAKSPKTNGSGFKNTLTRLMNAPRRRSSRLPAALQFPLVVLLSFSLSSLAYSFLDESTRGELATIAKDPMSSIDVAVLAIWRVFELALGWFGNLDGYDLAALNILSHGPYFYLVAAFYDISPWTAGVCLAIDSLSVLVPFLLLRPLAETHVASPTVPNGEIIADRNILASTGLLAGLIYGVTLFLAIKTCLGTTFVLYFEGISRLEPVLDSVYGMATATLLVGLLGLAAQSFIFTPSAATPGRTTAVAEKDKFDPASATLGKKLRRNLWGSSERTQVVILRTAVVMFVTWLTTYLQCALTIQGVEPYGAAAYASIWALAAMMTGVALELVGDA